MKLLLAGEATLVRLTEVKVAGCRTFASEITLVVGPTVTVLLGANDHGKSNLLSAVGHRDDDAVYKDEDLSWGLSGSSTSFPTSLGPSR